jgi:hypothetical protein
VPQPPTIFLKFVLSWLTPVTGEFFLGRTMFFARVPVSGIRHQVSEMISDPSDTRYLIPVF